MNKITLAEELFPWHHRQREQVWDKFQGGATQMEVSDHRYKQLGMRHNPSSGDASGKQLHQSKDRATFLQSPFFDTFGLN